MVHAPGGCRGDVETLEELDLSYPKVDAAKLKEIPGCPQTAREKK